MDKRVYKSNKMLIVRTQQCDKLVFEWERSKLPVIANQSADWCGNPPVEWNWVTITTKNRKVFPLCRAIVDTFTSNRGIATTSVHTGLAMTGNLEAER